MFWLDSSMGFIVLYSCLFSNQSQPLSQDCCFSPFWEKEKHKERVSSDSQVARVSHQLHIRVNHCRADKANWVLIAAAEQRGGGKRVRHGNSRAGTSDNTSGDSFIFKSNGYSSGAGKQIHEWSFLHFSLIWQKREERVLTTVIPPRWPADCVPPRAKDKYLQTAHVSSAEVASKEAYLAREMFL